MMLIMRPWVIFNRVSAFLLCIPLSSTFAMDERLHHSSDGSPLNHSLSAVPFYSSPVHPTLGIALKQELLAAVNHYNDRHPHKLLSGDIKHAIEKGADDHRHAHHTKIVHDYITTAHNIRSLIQETSLSYADIPLMGQLLRGKLFPPEFVINYFEKDNTKEDGAFSLIRMGNSIINHKQWPDPLHNEFEGIVDPFAAECFYIASSWFTMRWMTVMNDFAHIPSNQKTKEPQYMKTLEGRDHTLTALYNVQKILSWALYRTHKVENHTLMIDCAYHIHQIQESIRTIITRMFHGEPDMLDYVCHAPSLQSACDNQIILNTFHEPASLNELKNYVLEIAHLNQIDALQYAQNEYSKTPLIWAHNGRRISHKEGHDLLKMLLREGQNHAHGVIMPRQNKDLRDVNLGMDTLKIHPKYAPIFKEMSAQFLNSREHNDEMAIDDDVIMQEEGDI